MPALAPRFGFPVLAAVLVVLVAVLPGISAPQPEPTRADVDQTSYTCPSWEGLTVTAGQVAPGDEAQAVALPDGAEVPELADASIWRNAAPRGEAISVTQTGEGSGAVGFLAGTATGRGEGLAVAACPRIVDDAWFNGLGAVEGHDAELVLVNPGDDEAVVELRAWSPVGEVEVPDGDALTLAAGETRRLAGSDLAAGEALLTVRVARQRGVVVAAALESGSGPVRGSDVQTAGPAPSRATVMSGLPAGVERRLILTNPGNETANVEVSIVSADSGTFVAEGLDDVTVEPGSVREVGLPGEAPAGAAVQLRSSQPITGIVRSQSPDDVADSGGLAPLRSGPAVMPVVGDTQLTVVAPDADLKAQIEVFDAQMESLGTRELPVSQGSSASLAIGEVAEGGAYAVVQAEGGYAAARYVNGPGIASLPLTVAPVDAVAPAVSWGGRWH
ncbi:hypothetical protein EHW97_06880 [Aeromicrobium camelliae]|uniref:Uncharacterized protein n=1 Tax=Aeromicrobium camelliae TaxID=1538144 RepID=A0A3N6WLL3_9ACTN|nr:DUF5719 family protein [Aeromicrobium camelliae]RQN08329.1 hypothetical protein EHW97_06880 [Aeromicrobium camelliae]